MSELEPTVDVPQFEAVPSRPYDLKEHWRRNLGWSFDRFVGRALQRLHTRRPRALTTPADRGVFYIVQLAPDLAPQRLKFGFTTTLDDRLCRYRTANPNCVLLGSWPCRRSHERAAIYQIAEAADGHQLGGEVYDCDDPARAVRAAQRFFGKRGGA